MNTTKTQIPDEVNNFYDRNLLDRAVPQLVHLKWGQVRDIPKNAGTLTIKFRRYANLSAAKTPLSEGITPAGSQLSVTDITATVAQYGDFITLTDIVQITSEDPVLMETGELLGDQAADTLDQLTADILNAGTSVARPNSRVSTVTVQAGDVITQALIQARVLVLKTNKAKKVTTQVNASSGYNTSPIKASYIGICHTDISAAIIAMTGFVPVEKYASQVDVMDGEIGANDGVRWIETSNAKVFSGGGASGIDVYGIIIFGQHAYGTTRISGEAIKNIIKALGSAGSADPLDQRATSGWKATFVAKILNNDYITRLEVAKV